METSQISSKLIAEIREIKPKKQTNPRQPYFRLYYSKNKPKYLLSKQRYRAKLKANKPQKPLSSFQQIKLKQLLKLLVNYHSFVPVAPKLKNPVIKN
jgi:hypothetical protein